MRRACEGGSVAWDGMSWGGAFSVMPLQSYSEPPVQGIQGFLEASVSGDVVNVRRRARTTASTYTPDMFGLLNCSRPEIADCAGMCSGNQTSELGLTGHCSGFGLQGNVTGNCTCLAAAGYWSNVALEQPSAIAGGAAIAFQLVDIRNPLYSGAQGTRFVSTRLANDRSVNGETLDVPAILPGELYDAALVLEHPMYPYTLHPSPYTLHPSHCTPQSIPYTIHTILSTLNPKPHTQHPKTSTLNLKPGTLNPKP